MTRSKKRSRLTRKHYGLQIAALASGVVLTQAGLAQNADANRANTDASSETLEEVIVTGTLIRGSQPTGSELVTLDRTAILASGAQTTTNLMTSLPQLTSFNALPIGTSDFANPVPRFNIRATAGTLVLLNGHRMVGSGILQTTPDPSAIPIGAIERVEVLPDGASATYGADAVGGVVNFILRNHYDGAETRAVYGHGDGYHEYDLSQLYGKSWETGNILGSFEYTSHKNFTFGSRDYYNNDLTAFGGRNRFLGNCQPPNVSIAGVSYAGPSYAPGRNTCDPNNTADLLPYEQRKTFFLAGHQSLSDTIELTGDAFYSKRDQTNHIATSNSTFGITNANPYFKAPPGVTATSETVNYWFSNEFGPTRRSEVSLTSGGINVGLNFRLSDRWHASLSGDYGKGTTEARTPAVDGVALTSALAATTTATAFDPFTGQTSSSVLSAIGGGGVAYSADQKLYGTQFTVDGPLFALPGGDVSVAVGAQWRHEDLSGVPYQLVNGQPVDIPLGPQAAARRDMAEYVEILVPIVGAGNAATGVQKLVLSLAGRHDDYSDFGATTNPKVSLDYAPIEALTFHGTASTSFSAPSLADMKSVDTRLQTQPNAPFLPPGVVPAQGVVTPEIFLAGGTPTLQAQTARTYTFGFEVAPRGSGFNAGLTYWHSRIKKQISLAFPTNVPLFTNPAFASFWYGPGGQPLTPAVLDSLLAQFRVDAANAAFTPQYRADLLARGYILDLRRKNLGQTTIDGVDYHVAYTVQTGFGDLNTSLSGVAPRHRMNIPGPGAPQADLSELDPTTGRLALDWSNGGWGAGFNVNYVSAFNVTGTDVPVTGIFRVESYTSVDLRGSYRWSDGVGFLSNTDVSLQVNNVFDRDPPFVLGANGYNASHANQIGRLASLSLIKRW